VIFEIPAAECHVWISAFNASPRTVDELFRKVTENYPEVSVQLVDLDRVPGYRYLKLATVNAIESFHSKQPIAKTQAMELLLYISAEKQIGKAVKQVGITTETRRVAALAVAAQRDQVVAAAGFLTDVLGQGSEDHLLDAWPRKRIENVCSSFDIGEKELKAIIRKGETLEGAIERLAVERSAILAAGR
jgi:tRNA threonylcarbamoyladenosine modification (KEOPS) complex Cgi121 subunit